MHKIARIRIAAQMMEALQAIWELKIRCDLKTQNDILAVHSRLSVTRNVKYREQARLHRICRRGAEHNRNFSDQHLLANYSPNRVKSSICKKGN